MRQLPLLLCLTALSLAACDRQASPADTSTGASPTEAASQVASAAISGVLTDPASGAQCSGQDVAITRDGFNLVLNGDCGAVVITASDGAVNVEHATSLRVEGSQVTVLNSRVGDVDVRGADNSLNLTEVDALEISGDRNTVLARRIERVTFSGASNVVNPDNTPALEDTGTGNRVM